jgi:hypothetical protein
MFKPLLLISLFCCFSFSLIAQDTLPKITVSQLGRKVLISWNNPYTSVTNINIQRSADSLKNFTTIGSVINVDVQSNGFVDTKEFLPSNQYYRLFISFSGGSYIFTESHRPSPDTTKMPAEITYDQQPVKTWFVPSMHVYTGKDNNIIISVPHTDKNKYSIKFFEEMGAELFEVKTIPEDYLILDKVNFGHSGLFDFELFKNGLLIERHKLYIPRDGKPMPSLDINGMEIKPGK